MPRLRSCADCGRICEGYRCDECEAKRPKRPNFRQRGYSADWDRKRKAFLLKHPLCALCGRPANVADHFPISRKQLVAQGVSDPDAEHFLRPLCHRPGRGNSCHSSETAQNEPGGWNINKRA